MTIRERDGRWQAIVRVKKHGVMVFSEAQTFDTERLARDWKARMLAKLKKDGATATMQSRTTLGDLIDKYTRARSEVKPLRRTAQHELDQLHGLVGGWKLNMLSAEQFATLARKRRAEGAGPATVLHNLSTLRSILNAACPMFGIDVDGATVGQAISALGVMGHVSKSRSLEQRATDEDLKRLEAEFDRTRGHPSTEIDMAPVMWLAVHFPRRLGELCDMKWEDYLGTVMILHDTKHPRTPRMERVPVPPKAQAILAKLPRVDERVLPYKSESVSAAWQRATERVGLREIKFHTLRHEGTCRLFEAGLQIQEVALITGHQSWAMLRRYTHLNPEGVLEKLR